MPTCPIKDTMIAEYSNADQSVMSAVASDSQCPFSNNKDAANKIGVEISPIQAFRLSTLIAFRSRRDRALAPA